MAIPNILSIGTCRIFRPLRHMDSAGRINLLHYGKTSNWWFTHSSGEAVQYVKTIAGDMEIPEELRHLACETTAELPSDLSASKSLQDVDLVVVELSTFKKLQMNGVRLNFQNVWGYAHRAGVSTRDVLSGLNVEWPASVEPLKGLTVGKSERDEVVSDLLEIRKLIGAPMVTVDHIHALTAAGESIPGRPEISSLLRSIEAEHCMPFHSTRPVIEAHGRESALSDDNHYRPEFETVVGEALMSSIERALGSR